MLYRKKILTIPVEAITEWVFDMKSKLRLAQEFLIKDTPYDVFAEELLDVYPSLIKNSPQNSTTILIDLYELEGREGINELLALFEGAGGKLISEGINYNDTNLCAALSGLSYTIKERIRGSSFEKWIASDERALFVGILGHLAKTGIYKDKNNINPFSNGFAAESILELADLELFKTISSDWDSSSVLRSLIEKGAMFLPLSHGDIKTQFEYISLLNKDTVKSMKGVRLDYFISNLWRDMDSTIQALEDIGDIKTTERIFRFCNDMLNVNSIYRARHFIQNGNIRDLVRGTTSLARYAKSAGVKFTRKDIKYTLKPFDLLCKHTKGDWEFAFGLGDRSIISKNLKEIMSDIEPKTLGKHPKETLLALKNTLGDDRWVHNLDKGSRRDILMDELGV